MNKELLVSLMEILPYTQKYESLYMQLQQIHEEIAETERAHSKVIGKISSLCGFISGAEIIFGLATALVVLSLVTFAIQDAADSDSAGVTFIAWIINFLLFGLLTMIAAVLKKRLKNSEAEKKTECENALREKEAAAGRQAAEIKKFIDECLEEGMFNIVPPDYFYPLAVENFILNVRKTLADNMNDAIILFEDELKRYEYAEYNNMLAQNQISAINGVKDAVDFNTVITWLSSDKK